MKMYPSVDLDDYAVVMVNVLGLVPMLLWLLFHLNYCTATYDDVMYWIQTLILMWLIIPVAALHIEPFPKPPILIEIV